MGLGGSVGLSCELADGVVTTGTACGPGNGCIDRLDLAACDDPAAD